MRLKPASPGSGVRFRRMDLRDRPVIPAHHSHIVDTFLATTIGHSGVVVSTVEHLMAAFVGFGLDNVLVELDGPEVPILDGSAAPFMEILCQAGLKEQNAPRKWMTLAKSVEVRDGDAYIKASPSRHFRVRYSIDFPHPLVGKQELSWSFDESAFAQDIAKARTFGFLKDVQKLQSMGLAQGGSLANAIVFDDRGILNKDGFRYEDECVRHKILDFIGDLALAGFAVCGKFEVRKAGHALHNSFLKQLTRSQGTYAIQSATYVPVPFFKPQGLHGLGRHLSGVGNSI